MDKADQIITTNLGNAINDLLHEDSELVKKLREVRTKRKAYEKALSLINGKPLRKAKAQRVHPVSE